MPSHQELLLVSMGMLFTYNRERWDIALLWRHNGDECVSNHLPHDCLLNRLFGRWSKKTSKLRVTGLCAGNSPETGEFPAQMASNAENVSIWWRHHGIATVRMLVASDSEPVRYHAICSHRCHDQNLSVYSRGPFYWLGLTSIPAWISNDIPN